MAQTETAQQEWEAMVISQAPEKSKETCEPCMEGAKATDQAMDLLDSFPSTDEWPVLRRSEAPVHLDGKCTTTCATISAETNSPGMKPL